MGKSARDEGSAKDVGIRNGNLGKGALSNSGYSEMTKSDCHFGKIGLSCRKAISIKQYQSIDFLGQNLDFLDHQQ